MEKFNLTPPGPDQQVDSIELTNIPKYIKDAHNKDAEQARGLIVALSNLVQSGKGTERQMERWQKDLKRTKEELIDSQEQEEERSYTSGEAANETMKQEQGTA